MIDLNHGGLHSFPDQLHVIYDRGFLEKYPKLENVGVYSVWIFGFFEFIFYWCYMILISALVHCIYRYSMRRKWCQKLSSLICCGLTHPSILF